MRKIKVVVLLVQQLQHGFTKNAKVSPNLTVAHIYLHSQPFGVICGICVQCFAFKFSFATMEQVHHHFQAYR